jgi:hypothetical protein
MSDGKVLVSEKDLENPAKLLTAEYFVKSEKNSNLQINNNLLVFLI